MTLKDLCGDELYAQVQEKLDEVNGKIEDKMKHVRFADLSEGGYVAKDKFDAKVTELSGVKKQLEDASKEIQSYKDMDVESIQKSAKEWEEKYNTDTQELKAQIEKQERSHQTDRYLDTVGLKPGAMYRDFVKKAFDSKEFKLEGDKFLGADDYIAGLRKNPDFKDAFAQEESGKGGESGEGGNAGEGGAAAGSQMGTPDILPGATGAVNQYQRPLPQFAAGVGGAGGSAGQNPFANFTFTDVRPRPTVTGKQ